MTEKQIASISNINEQISSYIKREKSFLFVIVFTFLIATVGRFFLFENMIVTAITVLWTVSIIKYLRMGQFSYFLILFLISFFNFLMGRSILISSGMYVEIYEFTVLESVSGQYIVYLALMFLMVFYAFFKNSKEIDEKRDDLKENNKEKLKKMVLVAYIITYPFLLYSIISTVIFVVRNGYAALYLDYSPKVPLLLAKVGDLSFYFLLAYLYFLPKKKETVMVTASWFLYLSVSIFTGARFEFVIGVILIVAYWLYRNHLEPGQWMTKRILIIASFFAVIAILMLSIWNTMRFGENIKISNILEPFTDFFYSQGVNINNNKRIFMLQDLIPKGKLYSFNQTFTFLDRNINGRLLGNSYFVGNSIDKALNGYSLADFISYTLLGERYLKGYGVGTSYIAQVFWDFSYLGLLLSGILYSWLLVTMEKKIFGTLYTFMIAFSIFSRMLRLPRADFDYFVLGIIDPILWISILIIFLMEKYINRNI